LPDSLSRFEIYRRKIFRSRRSSEHKFIAEFQQTEFIFRQLVCYNGNLSLFSGLL